MINFTFLFSIIRWLADLVSGFGTWCAMDQSKKLSNYMSPKALECLDAIIALNLELGDVAYFNQTAKTYRTQVCIALMTLIVSANVFPIACNICIDDKYPSNLKASASQAISLLCTTDKEGIQNYGVEMMSLIATGQYDTLIYNFMSVPALYQLNPSSLNDNIHIIQKFPYMNVSSLYMTISQAYPENLLPHVTLFLNKLSEDTQVITVTLMILKK